MISIFIKQAEIKAVLEKFDGSCKTDIKNAIDNLYTDLGLERKNLEKNSNDIIKAFERMNDSVTHADAVFAVQNIGEILSDSYNSMSSEEKDAMLETVRDTDIPCLVKEDLCKTIMLDAISSDNLDRLRFAYAEADGISPQVLAAVQPSIVAHFGEEEAKRAEIIVGMKEEPELTLQHMNTQLKTGQITISQYIDMAVYASYLPEHYKQTNGIDVQLQSDDKGISFNVDTSKILDGENIKIEVNDRNEELTISKSDAVQLMQKHQFKNDSILDCVSEVNVPPTNPNFASELAQKANIYASVQYSEAISEGDKSILAYIMTDEQKSIFDNKLDDINKEYHEEVTEDLNEGDLDHDGISDIYPVDEYDEETEDIEEIMDEEEEENDLS